MAINIGDTTSGSRSGIFYTELMNLYIQYTHRNAVYEGENSKFKSPAKILRVKNVQHENS
jgi:hypothetical protein